MRAISIETDVNKYAEGSCLIGFGDTRVLVTATVEDSVPGWMRNTGKGWITAEELRQQAEPLAKNDYGRYLLGLLES